MKRIIPLLLLLALLAGCTQSSASGGSAVAGTAESLNLGGLVFSTDLERGVEEARVSGKAVFLYFQSEACFWCKKFEAEVLPDESVKSKLLQDFVLVTVDTDKQGKLVSRYGVIGTPTMVFLNNRGEEVTRTLGYASAEKFLQTLNSVKP